MEDQSILIDECEIEIDPTGYYLLAFDDDHATLPRDAHVAIHKKIDFEFPRWIPTGKSGSYEILERDIEFNMALPSIPMAPSSAIVHGHWTLYLDRAQSVVVKQVSITRGVPMADSFEVVSVFRATKVDDKRSKVKVTMQINYLKYVMMKGMLEKYTIEGVKEYVRVWIGLLNEKIAEYHVKAAAAESAKALQTTKAARKRKPKKKTSGELQSEAPQAASETEQPNHFKGMTGGVGLGIALRAAQPSNALILMNARSTVVTRATIPEVPLGDPMGGTKPQGDGEKRTAPEGGHPGAAHKQGGWGGRMPFTSAPSDKHSNGDVPDKSIREMASNVKFLIAQSDGMRSARTVILVLIVSHVILILFILYLFNEVSAIKAVLRNLHPEIPI